MLDQEFHEITVAVIDFEALTPAGRPHVPVEVAAVMLTSEAGQLVEVDRFTSLMRPPDDVPVTRFDAGQTGLSAAALADAPPAAEVMAALDAKLIDQPCTTSPGTRGWRLVAHHAATEANLIAGQREHCPRLAATSLLDTLAMARLAYPELDSHGLDDLLWLLKIPCPPDRHRALPDVEATVEVFRRMLRDGAASGRWSSLRDLDRKAGRPPATPRMPVAVDQATLF